MPDPKRIYWDSMTFNHRITGTHPDIAILKQISERAERGEIEIVTSAFTLCEVAKVEPKGEALSPEEQEERISRFFQNSYILLVQVDRRIGEMARDIVRRYGGIQGKDGVHIASALFAKATVLHTYDTDMLKKNGKIGNPRLRIEKPSVDQLAMLEEEGF